MNPAIGRQAKRGARARAKALTPKRRSAIAAKAARARWKHRRWPLTNRVAFQNWRTPRSLFDPLNAEFHFTLDAATDPDNHLCCPRFYTEADDGLSKSWAGERVWCNPPYRPDLLPLWVEKAYTESQRGALVAMLIPVRSDTRWWHAYVAKGEVRFLPGRVKFWLPGVPSTSSLWPSAVVVFRPPA